MRTISLTLLSGALCGCANVPVSSPQLDARTLCQQQAQASASAPEASDTQNGSFAIDEAELARFVEANAPPVRVERVETLPSVQSGTAVDELVAARVRADVAEKMLVVLQHQLAEMTAQRDRWEVALQARLTEMTAQRDRWEQRFDQLKLPAVNTGERRPWWRRLAG